MDTKFLNTLSLAAVLVLGFNTATFADAPSECREVDSDKTFNAKYHFGTVYDYTWAPPGSGTATWLFAFKTKEACDQSRAHIAEWDKTVNASDAVIVAASSSVVE